MDLPANIRIKDNELWIKNNNDWIKELEGTPNESPEDLYARWKDMKIDKIVDQVIDKDRSEINLIMSWVVPIVVLALAYFLSSFFIEPINNN